MIVGHDVAGRPAPHIELERSRSGNRKNKVAGKGHVVLDRLLSGRHFDEVRGHAMAAIGTAQHLDASFIELAPESARIIKILHDVLAEWLDALEACPSSFLHAFVDVAAPCPHDDPVPIPKLTAQAIANICRTG